jgi:hypothetical protein
MAATSVDQAGKDGKSVWQPSMQRWVWESGVEMGNSNDDEQAAQQVHMQEQEEEGDTIASETDEEDEQVDAELKSGLAKYIWHEDLEWDADGSGRLIVVGDVHGMVDQLK